MKYLDDNYYVEVKDHRYRIQPTEIILLRKRDPPTSLRTQYQVQNDTQIRKSQKDIENNENLEVKNYPKNYQPSRKQPEFKFPNCPTCKQSNWLEVDKGYYCKNCEYIINKQKHQIDEKVRSQDRDFSTRLNYDNEKTRKVWMIMVSTIYNSTEDMINKIQELKGKTILKFFKNISNYFDNMNIKMDEDSFAKNVQGIREIYHEVLLLMSFLQTKPEVKNMNINYYDLYHTVIGKRDDKEIVNDTYENDYNNLNDLLIPNHKPRETTVR